MATDLPTYLSASRCNVQVCKGTIEATIHDKEDAEWSDVARLLGIDVEDDE